MSVEAKTNPQTQAETPHWEPKILAFCCNWCSYAGADLAGLNRLQYPANVRIIRVPCSGRINPQFILRAFQRGIDGILGLRLTPWRLPLW